MCVCVCVLVAVVCVQVAPGSVLQYVTVCYSVLQCVFLERCIKMYQEGVLEEAQGGCREGPV